MAVPTDEELRELLDAFVCVRLVQMHGVDLARFAFDGVQTWAVFLTHGDGTVYARYGSRSGLQKQSDREISLTGFKKTLRAALSLHARYVADKAAVGAELAPKTRGVAPSWPRPEQIPTIASSPRLKEPFLGMPGQHGGCIHCHMVPAHELRSLRGGDRAIHDRLFVPFPMPNELGFWMDPNEAATVHRVAKGSRAERCGLRASDRIVRLDGQPILSTADIQWVLHNVDDQASLRVGIERGGASDAKPEAQELRLELEAGWRMRLGDWRFTNKALLRQLLGFNVNVMPAQQARRYGLGGKLAMLVDRTDRDLRMRTGLGNRDLIVAIDGKREPMTLGAFTAYVTRGKPKGSKLRITTMEIVDRHPRPEHEVEVVVR